MPMTTIKCLSAYETDSNTDECLSLQNYAREQANMVLNIECDIDRESEGRILLSELLNAAQSVPDDSKKSIMFPCPMRDFDSVQMGETGNMNSGKMQETGKMDIGKRESEKGEGMESSKGKTGKLSQTAMNMKAALYLANSPYWCPSAPPSHGKAAYRARMKFPGLRELPAHVKPKQSDVKDSTAKFQKRSSSIKEEISGDGWRKFFLSSHLMTKHEAVCV
eukprot:GHVR01186693.1.p1 GENE.GHVR01186693.1~~GHVR01186693.1.p1  ORF type:complete len:245 (+),score=38.50 GHVR01186693.1:74-736(+)